MTNSQPSYKLCMRIQRAQALLPTESTNKLNPYIVFQLQGLNEKVKTKVLKDTTEPIYNATLTLDGFFVGSDLLNVWVLNRGDGNESDDEVVGSTSLYVNTLSLGEVQNCTVELYKYDKKKNAPDRKKSQRGSAGKIFCQFHVAQPEDSPFVNKDWIYPLYNAWLEIIDAKNCPAVSDGSADPLVSTSISPASNTQVYKTKVMHSLTPVWNARTKILLDNYQKQTINISMESKGKNEKIPMGDYQLSLAKCAVGHIYEDNVELSSVNGQPPAILHYRLQITAKDTDPFKFIRDKTNFEEEESVKSSQSVKSLENQAPSNVAERSIQIQDDSTKIADTNTTPEDTKAEAETATSQKEKKKPINLSSKPKRRILSNQDVSLDRIRIPKGISDSPCVLHVNLIEARNLQKESDPFVNFCVRSYQKEASVKSKVIQNTQNPTWNENFDLNSPSLISDLLVVDMYNKDPLPENKLMDTIELPICDLPYKKAYIFDRDITLNDQTTGHLNFTINADTLDDEHCHFQWGELGSSYSTSFTGYSHKGHSLSAHSSDERNTYHVHQEFAKEMRKAKKVENITVTITDVREVPFESQSTSAYLTIQRRTKVKSKGPAKKFDDIIHSKQAMVAKFENVKPGNIIEILLYQYPSNDTKNPQLVCGKLFKVKDINFDGQQNTFKLLDPEKIEENYYNSSVQSDSNVGELKIIFEHEVSFK